MPRPEFQNRPDIIELAEKAIPPVWCFGAHWAPNGWNFIKGTGRWAEYDGDVFAALHGSWNRKEKAGYRIERIAFDKVTGKPFGGQMIVGTLDENHNVLGRPVDVVQEPDGKGVLFSDDQTRRIYRVTLDR